jgi:hypothetical protein
MGSRSSTTKLSLSPPAATDNKRVEACVMLLRVSELVSALIITAEPEWQHEEEKEEEDDEDDEEDDEDVQQHEEEVFVQQEREQELELEDVRVMVVLLALEALIVTSRTRAKL